MGLLVGVGQPSELIVRGVGAFRISGLAERQPAWRVRREPALLGEFAVPRAVQLSNPLAGLTGAHRHAGGSGPYGVADIENADTSLEDRFGDGPKVTEITLAVTADANVTEELATIADDASIGANAWTNPTNAGASDDTYATVTASGATHYLNLQNAGFALAAGAVIRGIEVLVERSKVMSALNTGATSPGTTEENTSVGTNAWTTPANAAASDNAYATCAVSGITRALRAKGFGFAIPTTATILGIEAGIERKASSNVAGSPTDTVDNGVEDASVGTIAWVNPSNITADDDTYAVANMTFNTTSHTRRLRGYTLSGGAHVPAGVTITGIRVIINRHCQWGAANGAANTDLEVRLSKDGTTPIGDDKSSGAAWQQTSDEAKSYGGDGDLWGTTWTAAEINAAAFSVFYRASSNSSGAGLGEIFFIDSIQVQVFYRDAVWDERVSVVKANGDFGVTNKGALSTAWPTADAYATYGASNDLWSETWTPADINDADFGVMLQADISAVTASVDHIRVTVYYEDGDVVDAQVRLIVDGVIVGANKADTVTQWPTADAERTYGGAADLWSITAPTRTQVNASTFGCAIAATKGSANGTVRVDRVRIRVYYTTGTATVPQKIWSDGLDGNLQSSRYIYVVHGSRVAVVDPVTDLEVESTQFGAEVVGGDAAYWAGRWRIAMKGTTTDYMQTVEQPYDGVNATQYNPADFTATALVAGPKSLIRSYISGTNKALIKQTTSVAAATAATGTLTLTGQPLNTETVTIATKVYTFQTVLTDVDGNVLIGASASASLDNLIAAITRASGAGTTYAASMTLHPTVTAVAGAGDTMTVTAKVPGLEGNALATTETLTNGSWGGATLSGATDAINLDANWAPSAGEQMGDPGIGIRRLAVAGSRFLAGKEDGLAEFDQDFSARFYLDWMRAFRWVDQCQGILPLGHGGDMIVTFRRGLWYLPRNLSIGIEQVTTNESDVRGRYRDIVFDGHWLYAALENPNSAYSHLVRMRVRRMPGPGMFEHHPLYRRAASQFQALFIWPGATVNGTAYGPRLYFALETGKIGYIRLGETQPDQSDANARFSGGTWRVEWPHDDFGSPSTIKIPYRIDADYHNVVATSGIKWEVRSVEPTDDETDLQWHPLTEDGTDIGAVPVAVDGYAQRFGPRDKRVSGRHLGLRVSGGGGSVTEQQHISGLPVFSYFEQPEMIVRVDGGLRLEAYDRNDDDAQEQARKLLELMGQGPFYCEARYATGEAATFMATFPQVELSQQVSSAEAPGVAVASFSMRAVDYEDAPEGLLQ